MNVDESFCFINKGEVSAFFSKYTVHLQQSLFSIVHNIGKH